MRSVVLGATGIVGGYIVAHLVRAGEKPVAISRSSNSSDSIEWVQGDLTAPQSLKLPDVDRLFCTVEVRALADALPQIRTPSLRRVVAFTSTSIVTKIESEVESERILLKRLADGEQRLIAICERYGIDWTILRPTIIYDEGRDANITRLARLIGKYGVLPLAGNGSGRRQPVHAADLAMGALQAAASDAATGKIYALPGRDTISYREMVGRIFDGLHKPRRILSVPPLMWRAAFTMAKPLFPNANAAMGSRMAMDMVFDDTPAKQDFGLEPARLPAALRVISVAGPVTGYVENMARMDNNLTRRSVAILMGTWNGAEHLDEQLKSFAGQTHSDWSLHVSDDGSSDATCDLVRQFAATVPQPVDLRLGPQTGFVDNFLTLARDNAIEATYFAFSDQDDIWYPDKLARAIAWFETVADDSIPAVYFSRTELITSQGKPRGHSTMFRRPATFRNALVQNIGGANTMVFNQAARRLLQDAADLPAVSHDWCLYLLVTAVDGLAYYDNSPTLRYRQHDGNVMGSNRGVDAVRRRFELVLQGMMSRWNAINRQMLRSVCGRMSSDNRETLRLFSEAREARWPVRLLKLKRSGVYRQTWLGNLGLALAALLGKI